MAFENITAESIRQNPKYQRLAAKMQRLSPERMAIFLNQVDRGFAGEEMKKAIKFMDIGRDERIERQKLELSKERFDISQGLRKADFDYERSMIPITAGIGLAGVFADGVSGIVADRISRETNDLRRESIRLQKERIATIKGGV